MKSPSKRTQRVAELIQRRLAQVIQRECKDPRLPAWITISAVEVSPDFSFAKVYFTVLNADPLETLTALNSVSSFLRAQLAKSLTIRIVPQLQFAYDESLEYGRKMQSIINQANINDDESDKT
jgi:ribosome-binding factor A